MLQCTNKCIGQNHCWTIEQPVDQLPMNLYNWVSIYQIKVNNNTVQLEKSICATETWAGTDQMQAKQSCIWFYFPVKHT